MFKFSKKIAIAIAAAGALLISMIFTTGYFVGEAKLAEICRTTTIDGIGQSTAYSFKYSYEDGEVSPSKSLDIGVAAIAKFDDAFTTDPIFWIAPQTWALQASTKSDLAVLKNYKDTLVQIESELNSNPVTIDLVAANETFDLYLDLGLDASSVGLSNLALYYVAKMKPLVGKIERLEDKFEIERSNIVSRSSLNSTDPETFRSISSRFTDLCLNFAK